MKTGQLHSRRDPMKTSSGMIRCILGVVHWLAYGCLLLVLVSCGSGSSTNSSSSGSGGASASISTPISTVVTVGASIPISTVNSIQEVISPSDAGSIGSRLEISMNGQTGQSVVLAIDVNGNIVLAAIVSSQNTVLSADSTALALVRLAVGDIPTKQAGSAIDEFVRDSTGYSALVAAVTNALNARSVPALDANVLRGIASVMSVVIPQLSPDENDATSGNAKTVAHPTVSGTGYPYTVIEDEVLNGLWPVQITGGDPIGIVVGNSMPIPWSASSVDAAGTKLTKEDKIIPKRSGLFSPGSETVLTSTSGMTLTLKQTPKTHARIVADLIAGVTKTILGFSDSKSCDLSALNLSLANAAELNIEPDLDWKAFRSVLAVFIVTDAAPLLRKCLSAVAAKKAIAALVGLSETLGAIQAVPDTVSVVTEAAYAAEYWSGPPTTVGVCEDSAGHVVNCADKYTFMPASLIMAPGATTTAVLSATAKGQPTGIPSGLTFAPETALLTINANTRQVTASNSFADVLRGGGAPINLTVADMEGAATGTLAVAVLYPQISPRVASTTVGGDLIKLVLTDANGTPVIVPAGVQWKSDDPAGVKLKNVLPFGDLPVTDPGTSGWSLWGSPSGSATGQVKIGAIGPDGMPYGEPAIINVAAAQLPSPPSQPQPNPSAPTICLPGAGASGCVVTVVSYGFYVTPVSIATTITTTDTTNGVSTSSTSSGGGAYSIGPVDSNGNGITGTMCLIDGQAYGGSLSWNYQYTRPVAANCSGPSTLAYTGTAMVSGASLVVSQTETMNDATSCINGTTVITSDRSFSEQHDLNLSVIDGSGSLTVSVNDSVHHHQHDSNPAVKDLDSLDTASGGGSGSWPAGAGTPLSRSVTTIASGGAIPAACR